MKSVEGFTVYLCLIKHISAHYVGTYMKEYRSQILQGAHKSLIEIRACIISDNIISSDCPLIPWICSSSLNLLVAGFIHIICMASLLYHKCI